MPNKVFLQKLGFIPKNNTSGIFYKNYQIAGNYHIEVDIEEKRFNFGTKIKLESGTTQNFSREENWVVFECVNRLLEKGYKPEDIVLEKTWKTGHGTSGRLDILVKKNKQTYLMIECKTWGNEFEKEFKKLQKDGGQLFTYFQQDKKAEYLMLYTSQLDEKEINYKNEIIKIEEHYREAGNVKDFYDRWNKLAKQNGIFDAWVNAYEFQSKALIKNDLNIIKHADSSFIFNRFLEILRHNVVSDKPNAFNKIFTLFLCKIIDETHAKNNQQLDFQWIEGADDNISFQKRLTDLYKAGMKELLNKEVKDLTDDEFRRKFSGISEDDREKILKEFTEIRLKKNNEFAFKEVFDDPSFEDNAKVVKEVVELLQGYRLRYNQKHQYLSDFFELLLTTGLKQESGQFFTPVPVAKYIIKSLPIEEVINEKVKKGNSNDLLPFIIDYAAGSGHFLTESMDEVQKIIDKIDENKFNQQIERTIKAWRENQFSWAINYVYGIEKDYRLVKTAKVSCYLHGDGLAKVIHGDGLQTFGIKPLDQENLKESDSYFPQDNKQFDIVISNPPYSVSAFKGTLNEENAKNSFELFSRLTDQSSEIECLFIERTKQLLKDGGFAGIILPSSILSNAGIYTKAREILFKYFEIIAITELGSGTFMATGTTTDILFLRRRTNYEWENIQSSVEKFFQNYKDVTVNGVENIFSKYAKQVWDKISLDDYILLCRSNPNEKIKKHDIYREYDKKIKAKNEEEKLKTILEIEKEKLLYFILAYPQKVIIVKSGKKKEEKAFLGYEFSTRRGYEGIHPIQRSKSVDECTLMFDPTNQENPEKASSYIYKAFLGKLDLRIDELMKKHVFQTNLVDMMTFDRVDFEKTISLALKKTSKIESKWDIVRLGDISKIDWGNTNLTKTIFKENGKYDVFSATGRDGKTDNFEQNCNAIILSAIGARCGKCFWAAGKWTAIKNTIVIKTQDDILLKYLFQLINNEDFWDKSGKAQPFITLESANNQKIPLPPKNIQEKIVSEIEKLEVKEKKINKEFNILKNKINDVINSFFSGKYNNEKLGNIAKILNGGTPSTSKSEYWNGGINWATLVDTKNKYLLKTERTISEEGLKNSSAVKLPINTIIFSSRATIGDISIAKIETCTNQGYKNFVCDSEKIDYEYLYYILKHEAKNIESLAAGMTYPEISKTIIAEYKIPLPNLREQQKIVAQIQKIEDQIFKLNQELQVIKNQKAEILKKYL